MCARVYLRAQALRDEDGDHNLIEDLRRQLVLRLERVGRHVRRPSDGQLAEERRGDEADNREHRLAAVHQLRLAHVVEVAAELGDRRAEAERVEANIPGHRAVERRRLLEEGDRGRFLDHHRLHGGASHRHGAGEGRSGGDDREHARPASLLLRAAERAREISKRREDSHTIKRFRAAAAAGWPLWPI